MAIPFSSACPRPAAEASRVAFCLLVLFFLGAGGATHAAEKPVPAPPARPERQRPAARSMGPEEEALVEKALREIAREIAHQIPEEAAKQTGQTASGKAADPPCERPSSEIRCAPVVIVDEEDLERLAKLRAIREELILTAKSCAEAGIAALAPEEGRARLTGPAAGIADILEKIKSLITIEEERSVSATDVDEEILAALIASELPPCCTTVGPPPLVRRPASGSGKTEADGGETLMSLVWNVVASCPASTGEGGAPAPRSQKVSPRAVFKTVFGSPALKEARWVFEAEELADTISKEGTLTLVLGPIRASVAVRKRSVLFFRRFPSYAVHVSVPYRVLDSGGRSIRAGLAQASIDYRRHREVLGR